MRLYNITLDVLEYLAFVISPIIVVSLVISVAALYCINVQIPVLGVAIGIMLMKNLYNLYCWVAPKLKG